MPSTFISLILTIISMKKCMRKRVKLLIPTTLRRILMKHIPVYFQDSLANSKATLPAAWWQCTYLITSAPVCLILTGAVYNANSNKILKDLHCVCSAYMVVLSPSCENDNRQRWHLSVYKSMKLAILFSPWYKVHVVISGDKTEKIRDTFYRGCVTLSGIQGHNE